MEAQKLFLEGFTLNKNSVLGIVSIVLGVSFFLLAKTLANGTTRRLKVLENLVERNKRR
jgi:hypothetical protein